MQLIEIPTEQTTAVTDAWLALLALLCAIQLWRGRQRDPPKTMIWCGMFGSLALGAFLGTMAHGIELSATTGARLWNFLDAALGLTVALFAVGAVYDGWGWPSAKRFLPAAAVISVGFISYRLAVSDGFIAFVVYESAAMLLALGIYLKCLYQRRLPGAGWMTGGVLLTLLAAGLQATPAVTFTLVWPFDHNGVFHLIQMPALICLLVGLNRALSARGAGTHQTVLGPLRTTTEIGASKSLH